MSELRYLALGDSFTIGEAVAEAERWPVQLVRRLREVGLAMAQPKIVAVTGWTTFELAAGMAEAKPQGPFDLVSLLIGVNNQYRGLNQAEYRREFVELLAQAIRLAGKRPFHTIVLSIPDWSHTPFAADRDRATIFAEIDAFNAINREETAVLGAHYVDVTAVSRQFPTLIAPDGLHPNGQMYGKWVDRIFPLAYKILNK